MTIEYLVCYRDYPLELSEWISAGLIQDERMIERFNKRHSRLLQLESEEEKTYHHIGQRKLYEFVTESGKILKSELRKFVRTDQEREPEEIELGSDRSIIDLE